jgi:hypothetical protein
LLVTGGSFVGDLGALWLETWYFLGGTDFDEDSVGDEESRSRREEVDVLERRGAFEVLGNLGDAELDTSGAFMMILVCYGMDNVLVASLLLRRDKERLSKLLMVVCCCPRGVYASISCVIIQSVPTCFHHAMTFCNLSRWTGNKILGQ